MNKIHIVNWLITRKCNLTCDYCRLVKNYKTKPPEYPDMKYYFKNEMSLDTIIEGLRRLKLHNANAFHIIYGGEPLLRRDLFQIINYCNNNDIHYTIISNNTEKVQPLMKELFNKVSFIKGFTASIDPIIFDKNKTSNDIFQKSISGITKLTEYSNIIKDVVAEITVSNENLQFLYPLVKELTNRGINSDITFVDISKSPYYDFSDVEDDSILVRKSPPLRDIINSIIDEKLNVHMRDSLLPKIYDILPSEYDCKLDEDFHTMCVDSDSTLRLCLRVKGVSTPASYSLLNIIDEDGKLDENINQIISYDKRNYCRFCNHSCYLMGELLSCDKDSSDNLIHTKIRKS
jgi:MoaA/NifB/PqqE/SkfB family radical SAM enzyme